MASGVRSLDAARNATVRICDQDGIHFGQGLMLSLNNEPTAILTCHHVVAHLTQDNLHVALPEPSGQLGQPIRATYDTERSSPYMDAVVLRIERQGPPQRPLLHALNPKTYSGTLPDRATCLGHWKSQSFDARVASTTRLDVEVEDRGPWPNAPDHYRLPVVFRLADPSDARPGISGSVVLYDNGVLGLAHFSRPAGPDQEREVYLVPLSVWADHWPSLSFLIEPLIDGRLRGAATVKRARSLEIGADVLVAGFRADIYIEPKAADQARIALAERGGVVVVGRPKSGKTRLVWQLLQEKLDAIIVIPHEPTPPNVFETSGLSEKEVILFFDDLHRSAMSLDPLNWRRRLENATGKRCLMICTSRDGDDWKQVERSGGGAGLLQVLGRQAIVYTSQVGTQGTDMSEADGLRVAAALGISKQEFRNRFDGTPGSLTLDLAEMRMRYLRLRDDTRAGISMSRLLDAAKLVYEAGQPRLRATILRAVAERIRGEGRMSNEAWETLERRTGEEGFGSFDRASGDLRTYKPYLEHCVDYKVPASDMERLVPILIEARESDGLGYLAQTLLIGYKAYVPAEQAAKAADEFGNASALQLLGWVLASVPGREGEAEALYRRRIEAGDTDLNHDLALLLILQPGREKEAEQAFRDAIKFGGEAVQTGAHWNLGNFLMRQPGREREAEQTLEEAKRRGFLMANVSLAELLAERPGSEKKAETAIAEAIAAISTQRERLSEEDQRKSPGDPDFFTHELARMLRYRGYVLTRQVGRKAEAEEAYREAILAGDNQAHLQFAALLANQTGREQEAEREFRLATEADVDGEATYYFGRFLAQQSGRETEAEELFRAAIERGVKEAYYNLGLLLADKLGRAREAEQAFKRAADGDVAAAAYERLGYTIEQQGGREQEAESAYRQAIAAGAKDAALRLGALLERQSEREKDAEKVYREAVSKGDLRACSPLGRLLVVHGEGREVLDGEIEQAFRTAIDGGDLKVMVDLSMLLMLQPDRAAEGRKMLLKAKKAGSEEAHKLLEILDRDRTRKRSRRR